MGAVKAFKYDLLRRLPGRRRAVYEKKYLTHKAIAQFHAAIRATSGMTSIDLGANLGEYARLMARFAAEVIAFEPDPWTAGQLRSNLSGLANVRIVEAAAGIADGRMRLYRHAEFENDRASHSQSSSLFPGKTNVSTDNAVQIDQVDLIRFLRELDRDIGVLKMDIEGAEVDLLEKLMKTPDAMDRIHYIFAETHESRIPEHMDRVMRLRQATAQLTRPRVNLFWK